jgi:hypothetical protein
MKNLSYSFIFLFLTLWSCQKEADFQEIKIRNQYALSLPKSLSKVDYLHEDASLQYQNLFTEFYTIVIDEPSIDFDKIIASVLSIPAFVKILINGEEQIS